MSKYTFTVSGILAIMFSSITCIAGGYLVYKGAIADSSAMLTAGITLLSPTGVLIGFYTANHGKQSNDTPEIKE